MNDVRDFGAVGDGITMDTEAIQRAIDAGGMVNFPPGTYLTGTIYLKSYGGLHLEQGAIIIASPNREDYNADDFCVQNRTHPSEEASGAHLIVGVEVTHVTLSGDGIIDGNRKAFQHTPLPSGKYEIDKWRPAQMIYFVESDHINIRDLELNNAPYWTCFLHGCEDVTVSGLKIYTEWRTRNGDGIDIDCCRRVTVSDCIIDTGDDCITLRGDLKQLKDQTRVCEDVVVTNCVLKSFFNVLRIGVGSGTIRRAVFNNIKIRQSRTAICVISKYGLYDGVVINDIKFNNIIAECEIPFFIASNIRGPVESAEMIIKNIEFNNISGTATNGSIIQGNPGYPLKNLYFNNVNFVYSGGENIKEEEFYHEFHHPAPPEAFHIEYSDEVYFDNLRLDWTNACDKFLYTCKTKKCGNVVFKDVLSGKPFSNIKEEQK